MRRLITLLVIGFSFNVQAEPLRNVLAQHASPYLAMHGHDPVAWQEWNAATVARARQENKLLFVSSGYFSCHWCHVMQRESYQNKEIARLLNQHFIPVKVDRELDGALDARMIEFVERTRGIAGWPLNLFITPQGYPLVGMVYEPAENFKNILLKVSQEWRHNHADLKKLAQQATAELNDESLLLNGNLQDGLGRYYFQKMVTQALTMADDMSGGFGQENKFPSVPQLDALLQSYAAQLYKGKPTVQLKHFLNLTLERMASQGLNDHLSGGFFRYAVDPGWQVPHFEKMLYDNALLSELYLRAAEVLQDKRYLSVAQQTLDFMLQVLRTEQGAFRASLSAIDQQGVEGGYYLWQPQQVKNLLTADEFRVAELYWGLSGAPELEDGQHLIQQMSEAAAAQQLQLTETQFGKLLQSAQRKLLAARQQRHLPMDSKILAGWNGLALSALAKAARQFPDKPEYAQAGQQLLNYLQQQLWDGKTLYRARNQRTTLAEGELDDYAYVAKGVYDWLQYRDSPTDRQWLKQLIQQGWQRFFADKGWKLAEQMLFRYGEGQPVVADSPIPSASATLLRVTLAYAQQQNDSALLQKALPALNIGHDELESQPYWYASQIAALYAYQTSASSW